MKDDIYIKITLDKKADLSAVIELLSSEKCIPAPAMVEAEANDETKKFDLSRYDDNRVKEILQHGTGIIVLDYFMTDPANRAKVYIIKGNSFNIVTITLDGNTDSTVLQDLFKRIIKAFPAVDGFCQFREHGRAFGRMHYEKRRTPVFAGLTWLQYFGAEEAERQGGIEAIERTPLISTERISDGILIRVGESPYFCTTKEGEELLLKATALMPPPNTNQPK